MSVDWERAKRAYYWSGFATGPDTMLASFWGPAMLAVAALDQTCSSDAFRPGQLCTPTHLWNHSLWQDVNGQACAALDPFQVTLYPYDPQIPACVAAYQEYSDATNYTCNCTGYANKYALLGGNGGLRASILPLLQSNIAFGIVSFVSPLLGEYLDYSSSRLKLWRWFWLVGSASTALMAILWINYVWIAGYLFAFITQLSTELATVPRSAYLVEIAKDDSTRVQLGSLRQGMSFVSQLIYVIIMTGISLIPSLSGKEYQVLIGATSAVICAIWYFFTMIPVFNGLYESDVNRERPKGARLCSLTFGSFLTEMQEMWRGNREAVKYLTFIFCMQNGAGSTVIGLLALSYLPEYLLFSATQRGVLVGVVLLSGAIAAPVLARFVRKYPKQLTVRRLLIAITLLWLFLVVLIPLVLPALGTSPDGSWGQTFILACVFGGVFGGAAFSWYFSLIWSGFVGMVPPQKAATYAGILYFVQNLGLIGENFIYIGVLQASNQYRIAILTLIPWVFLGLCVLLSIDFAKGVRDYVRPGGRVDVEVPGANAPKVAGAE